MIDKILIIYEEELIADGLKWLINTINENIEVTKKIIYNDLEESIDYLEYDAVIIAKGKVMDLAFISPVIKEKNPNCKIIYIAKDFTNNDIIKFMEYSVNAVLSKQYSTEKIKSIMGLILMGENYYPPEILPFNNKTVLTPQQKNIIESLRKGYSNKQIAYDLNIAESTVKAHMSLIMKRLKVVNRVQVIQRAFELGLIQY
jgi:DNA-binding NarL/FixJ family response regulator